MRILAELRNLCTPIKLILFTSCVDNTHSRSNTSGFTCGRKSLLEKKAAHLEKTRENRIILVFE